jgi:methylenetetrahydrofolate dehydrogenase (NADP+) / methenyltetrahydrofolate cyclohydrolase
MPAALLDGKKLAAQMQAEIAAATSALIAERGVRPGLATVLIGDDPASHGYVRSKRKACASAGMLSFHHELPARASQGEVLDLVGQLNDDPAVHGILIQLPLPKQLDEAALIRAVNPAKDVDVFHPENVGLLAAGFPRYLPCTPHGIQQLLLRNGVRLEGAHVVIVGRSNIVGKPLALILVQRGAGADATVTVCHSRTRNLGDLTRRADVVVVAIGKARFLTADMVRPGAVVVDVGMNRTAEGWVGDVDFAGVSQVVGAISPVPGGVGPMTITMLLYNTLLAAGGVVVR